MKLTRLLLLGLFLAFIQVDGYSQFDKKTDEEKAEAKAEKDAKQKKNEIKKSKKIVKNALETIAEFDDGEDGGIPKQLLKQAGGIIIFPKALKISIGMASQSGQGIALIRKGNGWSNLYFIKLMEASAGFQLGGQMSEIIMLVKDGQLIKDLEKAEISFGADVNATAGPSGTNMATDMGFESDIYTYQKSKGLYGGASLSGGGLIFSWEINHAVYGDEADVAKILKMKTPYNSDVKRVHSALAKQGA